MTAKLKFTLAIIIIANAILMTTGTASSNSAADDKKPTEKPIAAPLEGEYSIVSGEKDGKIIPPDRLQGSVVFFTADRIIGMDKEKKEFFAASYVLDLSHMPWSIKMKSSSPKEEEAMGLIKKDGDTVTLIYSLPGADAPIEFRTKDRQHLFVLKNLLKPSPKK